MESNAGIGPICESNRVIANNNKNLQPYAANGPGLRAYGLGLYTATTPFGSLTYGFDV